MSGPGRSARVSSRSLGAETIKIESPMGRGPRAFPVNEATYGWVGGDPGDEPWNRHAIFVKLQRNKRSVAIDLKTDAGRETFLRLARVADVVIENFHSITMPNLGLSYEVLAAENPAIIYVAMPGYGVEGAYSQRVAFGPAVEAMSGLSDVHGLRTRRAAQYRHGVDGPGLCRQRRGRSRDRAAPAGGDGEGGLRRNVTARCRRFVLRPVVDRAPTWELHRTTREPPPENGAARRLSECRRRRMDRHRLS